MFLPLFAKLLFLMFSFSISRAFKMLDLLITAVIITLCLSAVSPSHAANILAVLPHQGFSHHMVYLPILRELANRGHNVTVISNFPTDHSNITDVSIMGSVPLYNNNASISDAPEPMNEVQFSLNTMWSFYTKGKLYESMFTVDSVKQLINGPSKYDLLLTEHFNSELNLIFAYKFNIPFILMSSCNLLPWNKYVVGQPYVLAIKPSTLTSLPPKMNLYERSMNMISNAIQLLGFNYYCRKRDEEIIKQKLNMDVSLNTLVLNASLIFVNTHFTMFEPRPLVPAVVEVGGVHIQPIKPVPVVSAYCICVLSFVN